jgi:hypothetical protein
MMVRRVIYLGYYFKKLNLQKLKHFLNLAYQKTKQPRVFLFLNSIFCALRYNVSILEFFQFGFFEKSHAERLKWAGTGFMYEFQKQMNPKWARDVLENKLLFNAHFARFIKRKYASLKDIKTGKNIVEDLLSNSSGKIVLKNSLGQIGAEVEIASCINFSKSSLIKYMEKKNYNLVEEFVVQHPSLMELSPSGLNTVRVFTQLYEGKVELLGARLRITVNSQVDNMAAGNLAAPINMVSGFVNGPGVYSDISKEDQFYHPVTGKSIYGFNIPFWQEVINVVSAAALHTPENKSIGWDVAIRNDGPELIEGNHNWCKILWQLPVKKGLKNELLKYR